MKRIAIALLFAASCTSDDTSSSQQTVGSTASGYQGDSVDDSSDDPSVYEGLTCDDSTQGVAWCDDDFNVVYCSGGIWRDFDCAYLGQYCASDGYDVDCYDF
ncbi:MAG: hypothetical protein QM831_11055 [Kofleriaceae bacterium]